MQSCKGWMKSWTVLNEATDDGDDNRRLVIELMVPARSELSMAVAALSGSKAQLVLGLEPRVGGPHSVEIAMPVEIVPPWGAKKRGGFYFTAITDYSENRADDLAAVTQAVTLVIGVEILQDELLLAEGRENALAFVKADPQADGKKPRGGAK